MYRSKLTYSALSVAALAAGFIFSLWPLCLLGLLCAAVSGQYVIAIVIGLLLDVFFGAPVGLLRALHVPFMLLAFLLCALHYYVSAYVRQGDSGRL